MTELFNDGGSIPGSETEDDDKPRKNPMRRGWNRFAAEGYTYVNNNKGTSSQEQLEFGEDRNERPGRTRSEKQLCVLLVLSLVVVVCLLLVLVIVTVHPNQTQSESCQSPDCVVMAGDMISKMSMSIDPCDDFYGYACEVAINDPLTPPSAKKYGVFQQVDTKNLAILNKMLKDPSLEYKGVPSTALQKAKMFYHACMNSSAREEKPTDSLLAIVKDVGSWPLTNDSVSGVWDANSWSIEHTLGKISWYSISALFTLKIGTDDKNSSVQRIVFDQGGTLYSNYQYYTANDTTKYHDAYIKFFVCVTKLLGGDETQAKAAAQDVWDLEQALAKAFDKPEDRLDPQAYYHLMSLSDAQDLFTDAIDLNVYLKEALNETISPSENVLVYAVNYIPKMAALVKAADKRTLSTYMVWHVIVSMLPYMPLPFRMCLQDLDTALSGVSGESELWEQCVGSTQSNLGFVTGALYIEEQFTSQDRSDVKDILKRIRDTLVGNFPSVSWMDDTTRERAIAKADGIIEKIGYPDFITDPAKLDEYYARMKVTENSAFNNSLNTRLFGTLRVLEKRKKPTDKDEWHMVPAEVNAYYNAPSNEIVFPAGILQNPFYQATFPKSVLYGTVGMVMGHELSHAFDNQGRLFDVNGNMNNWWTNHSAQAFLDKTSCIISQYEDYIVEGEHVNGKTTLGENIADNAGLTTAYKAYKSLPSSQTDSDFILPGLNMTKDQLFFLGFAQLWCTYYTPEYAKSSLVTDVHTYAKYRVIGTLQNMPEFSEAYQCSRTSYMNPVKKCSVW